MMAIFCLALTAMAGMAFADQQGGQNPAAYLETGVGGTQEAMGGAAVAMRDNVANSFWNPAGLSGLTGFQVQAQDDFLSLNQEMWYGALANQFRDKFFYGLSWILYSAGGDLEARSGPSLEPDSVFGDTEMTFLLTFAFRLDRQWCLGFNAKVFTQSLNTFSGFGAGEDLGMQFRPNKNDTFGFVVQDPLSFFSYSNDDSVLFPIALKAGVSHDAEDMNARGEFDLDWSSNLGLEPHLGLEWKPLDALALRGGCWMGNLTAGAAGGSLYVYFSGGVGLFVPMNDVLMEFDYSFIQDRIVPGALTNQVAITGRFF